MAMDLDSITVLDVEEKPQHIRVVFETSGSQFDQSYPKRLGHNFPKEEAYLHRNESGVSRVEWKLKNSYLGYNRGRERFEPEQMCSDVASGIQSIKDELIGVELQ